MHSWFTLLLVTAGCARSQADRTEAPLPSRSTNPPLPPRAALAPLAASSDLVELLVPGFGAATVAVPRGATEPRPVVVALHGHAIRPEHACPRWQHAAYDWPFVLCPLGLPADARPGQPVTLGSPAHTTREIQAGLRVLREHFAGYLAGGRPLFVGWSQGAKVGISVARSEAFDAAAFGEGGYDLLDDQAVTHLAKSGLRRVLLLCATRACESSYARPAERLRAAGIPGRVAGAGGADHPFDGAAVETAREAWPWLVEGDSRFSVR